MRQDRQRAIEVWANWESLADIARFGTLHATPARGKEIFSFEYDTTWLKNPSAQNLDPSLLLFSGPQYPAGNQINFGIFLDSSPDRWGRTLMDRREVQISRDEGRQSRMLHESDYLLGVYDGHRMGGLRFRTDPDGSFLDDNEAFASPPWTSLRELEHASLELERDGAERNPSYGKWLKMLIAPGASLGGARPKASVLDEQGHLWIAKFPSRADSHDLGAWEYVVHRIAIKAGIAVAPSMVRKFNSPHHTFLTKRFDRTGGGGRLHFASAMTLLSRRDGDDASAGVSYLEMAGLIFRQGASPDRNLEQLWRRIVFSICVSNTDDHLRNHGFILQTDGWSLSPAYDMNPSPFSEGLNLNISETDNTLHLDLAREVAPYFRLKSGQAKSIIGDVITAVKGWRKEARAVGIRNEEQDRIAPAFEIAEKQHA